MCSPEEGTIPTKPCSGCYACRIYYRFLTLTLRVRRPSLPFQFFLLLLPYSQPCDPDNRDWPGPWACCRLLAFPFSAPCSRGPVPPPQGTPTSGDPYPPPDTLNTWASVFLFASFSKEKTVPTSQRCGGEQMSSFPKCSAQDLTQKRMLRYCLPLGIKMIYSCSCHSLFSL